jgi:hypothetical protein
MIGQIATWRARSVRHARGGQSAHALGECLAIQPVQVLVCRARQRLDAGLQALDLSLDAEILRMTLQQPVGRVADQRDGVLQRCILRSGGDVVVELFDLLPQRARSVDFARDRIGRATAAASAPVSCCVRTTNAGPMRLTMLLVVAVAMISRFRRCCPSRRA